jgi:hypothetical protein
MAIRAVLVLVIDCRLMGMAINTDTTTRLILATAFQIAPTSKP